MKQVNIFTEKKLKLELLLHDVLQLSPNDDGLQGHNDEVFASEGRAYRSDKIFVNDQSQLKIQEENIHIPSLDNRDLTFPYDSENEINVRPSFPAVIHTYSLDEHADQKILFNVNLFVLEVDNGDLGSSFRKYGEAFTKIASKLIVEGGKVVLGGGGALAAGPVGAFIGKEILGKGLEYLVDKGLDEMWDSIESGLNNDALDPFIFNIEIDNTNFGDLYGSNPIISNGLQTLDYYSKGAHYHVLYEWKVYREIRFYNFSIQNSETILQQYKANEKQVEVGGTDRCARGGFMAAIWTMNSDIQNEYQVACNRSIENFEWKIDGKALVADGVLRSLSIYKNVNRTENILSEYVNIIVEYSCTNFSNLKIKTKGEFGNYALKISLTCFGKTIINEDLSIVGQEFLGDKKYMDYLNCIGRMLQYKANLLKVYKLEDFVKKGGIPIEVFGEKLISKRIFENNNFNQDVDRHLKFLNENEINF